MSQSRHAEIATCYTEAARTTKRPLAVVAATFGFSQSTATRRVRECREMGLITEVPRYGNTIGTNPKLVAVANALGVSVDDLAAAISEHANGDLRVKL